MSEKPGKQAAKMPRSSTQVRVKRAKRQAELRRWPPESCTLSPNLPGDPGVAKKAVPHGCPTLSPCFSSDKTEASSLVTAHPRAKRESGGGV